MRTIGACYLGKGRCAFGVWAPSRHDVALMIPGDRERLVPMEQSGGGYWEVPVENVYPGARYMYRLDNDRDRPDPASHFQPRGVHGPSQVIDHSAFPWGDAGWRGVPLCEMIMYELHVGTFSPEGTFDAAASRLDDLRALGINAVEIMPVAQFPGKRNWGYDATYPFAVQNSYGGPEGLRRLVDACHGKGISVILDVVYNHLGPEGNYLWDFGPYFTEKYRTPWGWAINYDDEYSNDVRNYFISNALHWFEHYHVDALRIDAVHGITDMSARPFLLELAERVEDFSGRKGRKHYLIAESDLNDSRVIRQRQAGGYGLDAQWCDDFHHCVHTLLTGERGGYYEDFGRVEQLVRSVGEGFVYSGQYSAHRKRNHGNASKDLPGCSFVFFTQNHDQTGNRMSGERLSVLVSFEALKVAAGITLLAPSIPLLFMGEEYGEDKPFLYFISHGDAALTAAVREGRRNEFRRSAAQGEPPDPAAEETFLASKIDWGKRKEGRQRVLLDFYRKLIALRREIPALSMPDRDSCDVVGYEAERVFCMRRGRSGVRVLAVFNFNEAEAIVALSLPAGDWSRVLDSADPAWGGPGSVAPLSVSGDALLRVSGSSLAVFVSSEEGIN